MLPLSKLIESNGQHDLDVFNNGRYEEIVQMLSDLGYLSISAEEGKILNPGDFKKGVLDFRKEAISASLIGKSSLLLPFPDDPKEDHEGILTYREFSVLQLLVSLDGDFTLKPLSEIRNIGIYTRVIQYRLHLMGLLLTHPNGVYTEEVNIALNKLAVWLSPVAPNELLDITGNINKLISRLKVSSAFANKIIYFRFNSETRDRYCISGSNDVFLVQLKKDIDKRSSEFKQLKSNLASEGFNKYYFEKQCDDPDGNFLVRILQLSQWISGYYLGLIDGELGNFTFSSLLQLARSEVESGNLDFKMNLFVGYVADDYWVVNPHYLFGEMKEPETNQVSKMPEVFRSFDMEYEQLDEDGKKTVDENLRIAWKSINVEFSNNLKSTANRFSRIYYGARSMLQSFLKSMESIFKKLKEKVIDFASGLFNQVKNFAKFLYREIREALQVFNRGLNFLFGNRKEGTDDCFTKFDFDMDSITCVSVPLTEDVLKEHQQSLIAATTGLKFCLTLTGKIIHLAVSVSLGWPKLLLEAGIMLKQMVKECYSEKEYAGFVIDPQG